MMERKELRCRGCKALLAAEDASGVTIQRSGLRARVRSAVELEIVCYRCCARNAFSLSKPPVERGNDSNK